MFDGFICDTCGFVSSEEVGTGNTYYCPKCGNQMRRAQHAGTFGGGDANTNRSVFAWDLLFITLVGSLSFGLMNYISYWTDDLLDIILFILWIVIFLYALIWFHNKLFRSVSNKAIKNNNPIQRRTIGPNNIDDDYIYCTNCGKKLQKDSRFCSNCGNSIFDQ